MEHWTATTAEPPVLHGVSKQPCRSHPNDLTYRTQSCSTGWALIQVANLLWGRQLHEGLPQVLQRPLHQATALAEVHQQGIPQRLLGQYPCIAEQHEPIPSPCQCYIEPPGVSQKSYALQSNNPS